MRKIEGNSLISLNLGPTMKGDFGKEELS